MPGHGHVTALIRTNKAYVTCLTIYLTVFYFHFLLTVMYMVLFAMEFASLESKIHIT